MRDPIRVTTLTRIWRQIRRRISRNEWAVWLLGLSRSQELPTEAGLILVQIDGLAETQLHRAMENGRMPFLKSLLEKEHYRNYTFYSGLPSSTPSVQGELYYGQPTIVPAFGFRDHRTGHLVRMFASDIAQEVESKLSESNPGLLEGGSSYCNNYSGGADESHFCATSFGWNEFLSTVNPFKLIVVVLLNFWMFFRVAGLMVIELFLATFDFARGIFSGRQFWQELIMIPARVVVVVLLRELVTIGTCYDAARGRPVISLNFLGYDEQAHRRGPGSRFAHWTLRGIDNSIRRIWNSAHRGAGREYDLWVFSDHGQEETQPYQLVHGKPVQQVVADLVEEFGFNSAPAQRHPMSRLPTRARWLGIDWLVSMLFGEQDQDIQSRSQHVQTVTSGPLGFVFLVNEDVKQFREQLVDRLVREFHVPMAAWATENDTATVTTLEGKFVLPRDAVLVFGADHPFLEDVAADLIRLVNHPDSGDIVLIGWTHQAQSTSFVLQNGAHAGPGIEETRGFTLLPPDIVPADSEKRYLRPNELRLMGLRFLGRSTESVSSLAVASPREDVRVMTYNVHACVGMDGELSPERIARVIGQSGANIVCLQELDVFRHRSGNRDQAHAIAMYLEMNFQFHPAWHLEEEQFGNAILTRFPMEVVESKGIHHHHADRSRRSALWVEIKVDDTTTLQVINTHLSIYPKEQLIQAQELSEEWVQPASLLGPVVLCGDFNARPGSATHRAFASKLSDVESFDSRPTRSTYFSPFPVSRVDHIFVTDELVGQHSQVIESRVAKTASDHLPLVVDLKLKDETRSGSGRAESRATNGVSG
jgi:endonuclease/exonuclease/phosphatase family metal-dependent hydrolase